MADILPILESMVLIYPNDKELLSLYNHHLKLSKCSPTTTP